MSHNARLHCGPYQAEVRKRKKASQPPVTERNRLRKRLKHMRLQPNDLQTAKLL